MAILAPPSSSPFDTQEMVFRALTRGPSPLAVDGRRLGCGLPPRPIPLDELRGLLLDPATGDAARHAALAALVGKARTGQAAWVVGLVGVLLPGLRRVAGRLARGYPGEVADLHAEVLVGLLEQLPRLELGRPGLAVRLLWAGYRRGARLRRLELAETVPLLPEEVASRLAAPAPVGHPDLVLARAVATGALHQAEAELIAATRHDGAGLAELAGVWGLAERDLQQQRYRAEQRVARWLASGQARPLQVVPVGPGVVGRELTLARRLWGRQRPAVRFALGAMRAEALSGVAVAVRPAGRLDDGGTVEVFGFAAVRSAEVQEFLCRSVWRAADVLGYWRLVTLTPLGQGDAGLRAAGWRECADTRQPAPAPHRPGVPGSWRRWEARTRRPSPPPPVAAVVGGARPRRGASSRRRRGLAGGVRCSQAKELDQ